MVTRMELQVLNFMIRVMQDTLSKRILQLVLENTQEFGDALTLRLEKANSNGQFLETPERPDVVKNNPWDQLPYPGRRDETVLVVIKGDMTVLSADRRAAETLYAFHAVGIPLASRPRCEAGLEGLNRGCVVSSEHETFFLDPINTSPEKKLGHFLAHRL